MARGNWGQSDLGEAEDRIRSQLSLEGRVPVELEGPNPTIVPVMIIGDGTRPGMGRSRDRRFLLGWNFQAAGLTAMVQASQPIVIERAIFSHLGAGTGFHWIEAYYAPGTVPGALVFAPPTNPFLDRGSGDLPPVLVASNSVALAQQGVIAAALPNVSVQVELGFQLIEGAAWGTRGIAASTGSGCVVFQCRTF